MSDTLLAAIIGLVGTIITALATIGAASINAKPKKWSKSSSSIRGAFILLVMFVLGGSLLLYSLSQLVNSIAQPPYRIIDLGSKDDINYSELSQKGQTVVFAHYPAKRIQYFFVHTEIGRASCRERV